MTRLKICCTFLAKTMFFCNKLYNVKNGPITGTFKTGGVTCFHFLGAKVYNRIFALKKPKGQVLLANEHWQLMFNPFMPNGLSHLYQLDQSISNYMGVGCFFFIFSLSKFQLKILLANSEDPIQTLHYAVSDLNLHCLSMSHKKNARLIWVDMFFFSEIVGQSCKMLLQKADERLISKFFSNLFAGAQWLSGRVLDSRPRVRASPASLRCGP